MSDGTLQLGIDTGGTFTDAVLLDEAEGVIASAKAPTTRHDLAIGIAGALKAALAKAGREARAIRLVGLSTTLATNAIVEGQGGRAALILIGFSDRDLQRGGLGAALGDAPVLHLQGGHDSFGAEAAPLDLAPLAAFLHETADKVDAYAVAGLFSVRNGAHEARVFDDIRARTGKPVSLSHHLAQGLDAPRRALTAYLNARLVPVISELLARVEAVLSSAGISAPVMVVRGNGALMAAAEALARPVETVLSGPAASAVGAAYLTGLKDAVISDIGGTTTDIGLIRDGAPLIAPEGARVGSYRPMVEAMRMATIGLGGDSLVHVDDEAAPEASLTLGPQRVVPLAMLASEFPSLVHAALDRQLARAIPHAQDGRFVRLIRPASGLSEAEAGFVETLKSGPAPLDSLVQGRVAQGVLNRLIARGLVQLCGLTPTDAAHQLDLHISWDKAASGKGLALFLRRRNRLGQVFAASPDDLARRILALLVEGSADAILDSVADSEGLGSISAHPLARFARKGAGKVLEARLALRLPLIGLGAAAPLHYPEVARVLGAKAVIPAHAGVANAIGAVVGQARRSISVLISAPQPSLFRVHSKEGRDFSSHAEAVDHATREAEQLARAQLAADGATLAALRIEQRDRKVMAEGAMIIVETLLIAHASGRPALSSLERFPT